MNDEGAPWTTFLSYSVKVCMVIIEIFKLPEPQKRFYNHFRLRDSRLKIIFDLISPDQNLQVLKAGFIWSFQNIHIVILNDIFFHIFDFKT